MAVAGSLFPQPAVVVQPLTARTWKVYSVPLVRAPDGVAGGVHAAVSAVGDVGPRLVCDVAVRGLPDLVLGDLDVVHEIRVAVGVVDGVPGEHHRARARGGRQVGRGCGLVRGVGECGIGHVKGQSLAFDKQRIRRIGTKNGKRDLDGFLTLQEDRIVRHLNPVVVCRFGGGNVRLAIPLEVIKIGQGW